MSSIYMLNSDEIKKQIAAAILSNPELADDELLRADHLEGETSMNEFLVTVVRQIEDTKSLIEGSAARVTELEDRLERFERRVQSLRNLALSIMDAAALKRIELPTATLSLKRTAPKVLGNGPTNIEDLRPDLVRVKKEPDKSRIKQALEAGDVVDGFVLSNGGIALQVSVK